MQRIIYYNIPVMAFLGFVWLATVSWHETRPYRAVYTISEGDRAARDMEVARLVYDLPAPSLKPLNFNSVDDINELFPKE